jgi:enoyl-CoA hydratase/carnithine racemase
MSAIEVAKSRRIAVVTLNRPEARNAINQQMHDELCAFWASFDRDPTVDVAILTGRGSDAFCAGADPTLSAPAPILRSTSRNGSTGRFRTCATTSTTVLAVLLGA